MRLGCIIQARTGSTRLPNKVNADIGGKTMLWHVTHRMAAWEPVVAYPEAYDCPEDDVLARYALCARAHALDAIMRVTGDCPLIDPGICQRVFSAFLVGLHDFVANDIRLTFPRGLGCEVFTRDCLEWAHKKAEKAYDREHVSPFMKRGQTFEKLNILCPIPDIEHLNFSVDTQEDLELVRDVDKELGLWLSPYKFSLNATLEAFRRVKAKNVA